MKIELEHDGDIFLCVVACVALVLCFAFLTHWGMKDTPLEPKPAEAKSVEAKPAEMPLPQKRGE